MSSNVLTLLALAALASPLGAQPFTPAFAMTTSSNPAPYGAPITLTVTVSGPVLDPAPSGLVTLVDSTSSTTGSVIALQPLDASGRALFSFPIPISVGGVFAPYVLSGGKHTLSVLYSGDANYPNAASQALLVQQVQPAATSTVVSTSQNSQGATALTALVAAAGTPLPCPSLTGPDQDGSPTGTVQFFNSGASLGSAPLVQGAVAGCVSVAILTVQPINGILTATYSGDGNFTASSYNTAFVNPTGPSQPLLPTTLSLDATPAAPTIVQPITFTATVGTGASPIPPTGIVQFYLDGAQLLGTFNLAGPSVSVTASLASGSHSVSANYNGDANYLPSTMAIGEYVSKLSDSLTLTSGVSSAAYGQTVTLTAQIKPQTAATGVASPSGTVQFSTGCACGLFGGFVIQSALGTATLSQGVATLTVPNLAPGTSLLVASYSGDSNWVTISSSPVTLSISKAATTTTWTSLAADPKSGNPSVTATVQSSAGIPTGTLQVLDAATSAVLATAPLSATGAATATFPAKTSAILAVYSGDANFASSASAAASLLTIADAAGYGTASVAPDEIVSLFGGGLAAPVQIVDSAGVTLTPVLLLTSPAQINLVIPTATALGQATVTVSPAAGPTFSKPIPITQVAPGLFAANGGGTGPAAAQIIRVHADGSQTVEPTATLDATGKQWVAAPISFGADSLYLVLYGTGIRNRSSNANVFCMVGGQKLAALYSGAQGAFAGLDQVNVALPAGLQGAGSVNVTVTADGQPSNTVTLTFQ